MEPARQHSFTLHESLVMAALAALGGVSSSAVSLVGASLHAAIGLPGGFQFMAGIHVLWLVLAVGLIRKPGSATVTGVLKGAVELLSGNPHGLNVLLMSGLAGLVVDVVWLLGARRDRLAVYLLAGGLGAASNLLIWKLIFSPPAHRAVHIGLCVIAGVAFVSGMFLAGLLGWSLMHALRRAGVVGAQRPTHTGRPAARTWKEAGAVGAILVLAGTVAYLWLAAPRRVVSTEAARGEPAGSSESPSIQ